MTSGSDVVVTCHSSKVESGVRSSAAGPKLKAIRKQYLAKSSFYDIEELEFYNSYAFVRASRREAIGVTFDDSQLVYGLTIEEGEKRLAKWMQEQLVGTPDVELTVIEY